MMSMNYELLRNMYPEWESQSHPLLPLIKIFLAVALFLLVPYIYVNFIEVQLSALFRKIRLGISLKYGRKLQRMRL